MKHSKSIALVIAALLLLLWAGAIALDSFRPPLRPDDPDWDRKWNERYGNEQLVDQ